MLAVHRTKLAAALLLLAIWVTVRAAAPSPPETTGLIVAAHDLPAGYRLTSDDLRTSAWPVQLAPGGQVQSDAAGQVLASPVREGEPITSSRILGPGLLDGLPPEIVAIPVRLSDPASAAMVRPGDRVDVLASTAANWSAEEGGGTSGFSPATTDRAARNALVLSVSGAGGAFGEAGGTGLPGLGGSGGGGGDAADDVLAGVVVLAVRESEVDRLAGAVTGAQVSVAVLPRP